MTDPTSLARWGGTSVYGTTRSPECNRCATCDDVKPCAEAVVPVIRANAPDSVVPLGSSTWSQDVDLAAADSAYRVDDRTPTGHDEDGTDLDRTKPTA